MINPPHGERLETDAGRWRAVGDLLKQQFKGWKAAVLAGEDRGKQIGLRPRRRIPVMNGPTRGADPGLRSLLRGSGRERSASQRRPDELLGRSEFGQGSEAALLGPQTAAAAAFLARLEVAAAAATEAAAEIATAAAAEVAAAEAAAAAKPPPPP